MIDGAVITLLSVCRIGHRDAYADVFVVAIAAPMVSVVVLILLASILGSF